MVDLNSFENMFKLTQNNQLSNTKKGFKKLNF